MTVNDLEDLLANAPAGSNEVFIRTFEYSTVIGGKALTKPLNDAQIEVDDDGKSCVILYL